MKKLYKLIIGSYIGPFFATFFIVLFILVMQFLWLYIDELVGKGLSTLIILELLTYASAHLVPMALPLAILLSSIMTLGNLGENYELIALKSSGLSLLRILFPLIVVVCITAASAFYFANNIWPIANLKFNTLLYDIRHKKPAIDLKPGVYYRGLEGYVIRIENKDDDGNMLYGIVIYDHSKRQGANKVIRAESGKMEMSEDEMYLNLTLYNGNSYDEVKDKDFKNADTPHIRFKFKEKIIRFDLSGFQLERTKEDLFKNNYQMLSISQLNESVDSLNTEYKQKIQRFKEQSIQKYTIRKDSVLVSDITHLDNDTLYPPIFSESWSKGEKLKILDMAINLSRSEKTRIASTNRDLSNRQDILSRYNIEWHRKFTLAFTCIVLFFIGAPLGAIIRKGGFGLPVVIAVFGFLIFYMLNIIGEKLVKEESMTAFQGMWLSSYSLFPIAIFLTYKATTDAMILDGNYFHVLVQKISKSLRWITRTKSIT